MLKEGGFRAEKQEDAEKKQRLRLGLGGKFVGGGGFKVAGLNGEGWVILGSLVTF
jgi:hypothetical protein